MTDLRFPYIICDFMKIGEKKSAGIMGFATLIVKMKFHFIKYRYLTFI